MVDILGALGQAFQAPTESSADYAPRGFNSAQERKESGGRQHDSNGKPLVGRYPDGSTPRESEKAYGVSQIQIGTARNTARKHGIPWDENKLLNDKEYNRKLGDLHMRDLEAKYQDRRLAEGAYHSGEPRVDRAIAKYGRENFHKGLGPVGRKYVGQMETNNSTTPSIGIADPSKFLAGLESAIAPQTTPSSQKVQTNASATFGSDDEMEKRGQALEAAAQNQVQKVDALTGIQQALHASQITAKEQQISETRSINDTIIAGNQAAKEKIAPVIKARSELQDQITKVNSMNPLERGLRGIFDLNYDDKYLNKKMENFESVMKARAYDTAYMNDLHKTAMETIDRRYSIDTAMSSLMQSQAQEDIALAGHRMQAASGAVSSLRSAIDNEGHLMAAKAGARADAMSRIDKPTLIQLAAEARANGGEVKFGEVTLSGQEVEELVQARESREFNIESLKLGIANGHMNLAEKAADNIARTFTRSELEGAIANGGMVDGVQYPMDTLTQLLAGRVQHDNMAAETIKNNLPAQSALKLASDSLTQTTSLYQRGKGLYGAGDFGPAGTLMSQSATAITQLSEAVKNGQPPEVISALTAKVVENQEGLVKHTRNVILRQAGGDKRAAGYMESFVFGTPMEPGTAAEAVAYFATKGNLPSGLSLTGATKSVFMTAQKLVADRRESNNPNTGKPWTEAALISSVTRELTEQATKSIGQERFNLILADLPAMARQENHPLGRMKLSDWRNAVSSAEHDAITMAATTTGATYTQAEFMYKNGRPESQSDKDVALYGKFKAQYAAMNAAEMRFTAANLDQYDSITPGRRNSSVLLDYIQSGRFSKQLQNYGKAVGNVGLADYLVAPLSRGATEANFSSYARDFTNSRAQESAARRQLARHPTANTFLDPAGRWNTYFGAMHGVGAAGARALAPHLAPIIKEMQKEESEFMHLRKGNLTPNAMTTAQDDRILTQLSVMKFDDPALETYRRNAVKDFPKTRVQVKGFMDSAIESIGMMLSGS